MKRLAGILLAAVLASSCGGGDDDDGTTVDSGAIADAAATVDAARTPDSSTTSAGSATWQLQPNAQCSATITLCSDGGAVGGYQLIGMGACPLSSTSTFYFHGGGGPPAAGSYPVRAATSIVGAANVPAGEVVVRIIHHPSSTVEENWFAQSGNVTVSLVGGKLVATLPLVSAKKDTTALTQMMMATTTCP
ncbi:MAG: hypothetical protein IT370_15265 [Deltaproteobacteria bacterium]|nr:hypothetical protein [Deltaproteobacteria bacterium]